MIEPEIQFPLKCPVCFKESLTGFRISVVAEGLQTLEMRLYANCHVTSWDASEAELERLRKYLDVVWSEQLPEAAESPDLVDVN